MKAPNFWNRFQESPRKKTIITTAVLSTVAVGGLATGVALYAKNSSAMKKANEAVEKEEFQKEVDAFLKVKPTFLQEMARSPRHLIKEKSTGTVAPDAIEAEDLVVGEPIKSKLPEGWELLFENYVKPADDNQKVATVSVRFFNKKMNAKSKSYDVEVNYAKAVNEYVRDYFTNNYNSVIVLQPMPFNRLTNSASEITTFKNHIKNKEIERILPILKKQVETGVALTIATENAHAFEFIRQRRGDLMIEMLARNLSVYGWSLDARGNVEAAILHFVASYGLATPGIKKDFHYSLVLHDRNKSVDQYTFVSPENGAQVFPNPAQPPIPRRVEVTRPAGGAGAGGNNAGSGSSNRAITPPTETDKATPVDVTSRPGEELRGGSGSEGAPTQTRGSERPVQPPKEVVKETVDPTQDRGSSGGGRPGIPPVKETVAPTEVTEHAGVDFVSEVDLDEVYRPILHYSLPALANAERINLRPLRDIVLYDTDIFNAANVRKEHDNDIERLLFDSGITESEFTNNVIRAVSALEPDDTNVLSKIHEAMNNELKKGYLMKLWANMSKRQNAHIKFGLVNQAINTSDHNVMNIAFTFLNVKTAKKKEIMINIPTRPTFTKPSNWNITERWNAVRDFIAKTPFLEARRNSVAVPVVDNSNPYFDRTVLLDKINKAYPEFVGKLRAAGFELDISGEFIHNRVPLSEGPLRTTKNIQELLYRDIWIRLTVKPIGLPTHRNLRFNSISFRVTPVVGTYTRQQFLEKLEEINKFSKKIHHLIDGQRNVGIEIQDDYPNAIVDSEERILRHLANTRTISDQLNEYKLDANYLVFDLPQEIVAFWITASKDGVSATQDFRVKVKFPYSTAEVKKLRVNRALLERYEKEEEDDESSTSSIFTLGTAFARDYSTKPDEYGFIPGTENTNTEESIVEASKNLYV